MESRQRASPLARYGVALAATALALLVRLALGSLVNGSGPFLFFAPAVMVAAWYGGAGPGLLATVLGAFAGDYFLLVPHGTFTFTPSDRAKVIVYLFVGVQISWLSGALLAAKQRAQANARALKAAHDKLEQRVDERTAELLFQTTLLEAQSNASLDGILVASDDGRVIFHNRRVLELWDLPDAAFSGNLDTTVLSMRTRLMDHQDPLAEPHPAALPGDTDPEAPINLVLHDGRTLECYGAPVRSGKGHSYGRVWYFRDITERKRVAKQILEAGERERQRIGQDLHDDLCQHLTGITCLGRVLEQRLRARLPEEAGGALRIAELVEQAVVRARDVARGLQPLQLQNDGLAESLQELAANIESMFQVRCRFRCDQPPAIADPAAPIQLYRITQEAINNAIRHGKARNILIDLLEVDGRMILSIEDDGKGIGAAAPTPGLGLQTMRHRARMIGGSLSVEPAARGGTLVTCTAAVTSDPIQSQPTAALQPQEARTG